MSVIFMASIDSYGVKQLDFRNRLEKFLMQALHGVVDPSVLDDKTHVDFGGTLGYHHDVDVAQRGENPVGNPRGGVHLVSDDTHDRLLFKDGDVGKIFELCDNAVELFGVVDR